MAPDKLAPEDPRATHHTIQLKDVTYHYIVAKPSGQHVGTALLVHGFPDLGHGWRYQVPALTSLGLQVVVPDMLGYSRTDAPDDPARYSLKKMSADIAELVAKVAPGEQIYLGGHDWGGFFVWRMALWYPDLIKAIFSVCTPYQSPSPKYIDLETMVSILPNFKYQLQLAGPDVARELDTPDKIRGFLNGIYGGKGPNGERTFSTERGVLFENLDKVGPTPLLSEEEMDYYVTEFSRHGLRGPTNWYRTRQFNWEDDQELIKDGQSPRLKQPSLMVAAEQDAALPPAMTKGMEQHFDSLIKKVISGSHWCLWQSADEVNSILKEFLGDLIKKDAPKPSI